MTNEMTNPTNESMDDYKTELESSFRKLSEGDIITGTVIAVTEEEVTLTKCFGGPPGRERRCITLLRIT